MKKLKALMLRVLAFLALIVFFVGIMLVISVIQDTLFVPEEYLIWTFNSPYSGLVFVFETYLIAIYFYIFKKDFRESWKNKAFFKKYRKPLIAAFTAVTILLLYAVITPVSVVTNDKIINHSLLFPQGKEYSYNDIVKIRTGVYAKGRSSFFGHRKGDFFYIIELNDGTIIDLAEVGQPRNDEDERFILERLDRKLVNLGIPKESSMENFEYTKKNLAKIYTDKIRSILENTK
jgi:hypothetical protein